MLIRVLTSDLPVDAKCQSRCEITLKFSIHLKLINTLGLANCKKAATQVGQLEKRSCHFLQADAALSEAAGLGKRPLSFILASINILSLWLLCEGHSLYNVLLLWQFGVPGYFFSFFPTLCFIWDLCSLTKDGTRAPYSGSVGS